MLWRNRSDLIEALIPDERDPNRDVVDRFAVHGSARTSAIEEMFVMSRQTRRGPGPSSTLITLDQAGNVVGIDPHKRTLTATIVDPRGGLLASEHFRVSGDVHRALEAWASVLAVGARRAGCRLIGERYAIRGGRASGRGVQPVASPG